MALDDTVKRLRALLEQATPGVWKVDNLYVVDDDGFEIVGSINIGGKEGNANAALCAEARNALPALLDAADLLCRLEAMNVTESGGFARTLGEHLSLHDALEAARREQARERGGSDGR